jgi:vitamin B12 transporter
MHSVFLLAFALSIPSFADDKVVVTATRNETYANDIPFSVGTVGAAQWSQSGGRVETALSRIPGVAFTESGGPGQTRSLLLRGAKAEHTLVLIDGILVNDPLSPARAFDFGQLPVDEIERIEVIKGPQSVLYGSDAMGGVVQIFTRHGKRGRARVEGGSYGTVKAGASAMGFRAGYMQSRGFSSADENDGNTEADASRSWNLGGTQDFPVSDHFLMRLNAQYSESKTDTDRHGGAGGDSRGTFARHNQFLLREENVVLLPEEGELSVAGSYASHYRDDNTSGADFYDAALWKAESVLRKPGLGAHSLTAGAEYGEEAGRSSQISGGQRRFRAGAFYLQDQLKPGDFQIVAGARLDLHSATDAAGTYRLGLGYWLVKNLLRAKASVGTGFKAPSLYQTYSIYGSPSLRAERSVGGEAGLELSGRDWSTELAFFANRFRDMIDFNPLTSRFFNQSRAETYGLEWSSERRLGFFHLGNALTLLRAVDPDTGLLLLRRPRLANTVSFGYHRSGVVDANLHLRYVGSREDSHPVLLTRQRMPSFFTLGMDLFHEIENGLRFVARGENLLNRRYQETSGFGVPALSGYAGIEADL